jgi:hypothetical protein
MERLFPNNLSPVITEAQDRLEEAAVGKGSSCPCCGQFVKVYRRKLYTQMAMALVHIYQDHCIHGFAGFIHVPSLLNGKGVVARGGDYTKLEHWGLIEPQQGGRNDGSYRTGMWRVTQLGRDFVEDKMRVPSHAWFYNNQLVGMDHEMISIREALGQEFDYGALMQAAIE